MVPIWANLLHIRVNDEKPKGRRCDNEANARWVFRRVREVRGGLQAKPRMVRGKIGAVGGEFEERSIGAVRRFQAGFATRWGESRRALGEFETARKNREGLKASPKQTQGGPKGATL